MKSLINSINESMRASRARTTNDVNLIVGCSVSMTDAINDIQDIYNFYNKPNLYLLDGNTITEFDSVRDLIEMLDGGHNCSFDTLNKFYKKHIGELNIFIQN